MKLFYGFIFKVINIVLFDQNKIMNMVFMKKCQSLNKMTKELYMDVVQFWIFFFKTYLYIFLVS